MKKMLIFPQCFILVYQKKVCRFSCCEIRFTEMYFCEITLENWLNFLCFLIKALLNPLINNSKIIINYISLFWISLLPIFPFLKGFHVFTWMQDPLLNLSTVKIGVQPQNLFFSLFSLPFYTWIIFCFGWFTVSLSALMYFEKFLLNFSAFRRLLIKDITDVPPCRFVCHVLLSVLFFFSLHFLFGQKRECKYLFFIWIHHCLAVGWREYTSLDFWKKTLHCKIGRFGRQFFEEKAAFGENCCPEMVQLHSQCFHTLKNRIVF